MALAAHEPALAVELLNAADAADLSVAERAEALVEAYSMAGARDDIEHIVAAVWDEPLSEARRAHLAKRLADSRFFNDSDLAGALAAHEAARERMSDPDEIAAVDARRAMLLAGAGRPLDALVITDAMASGASPRTRVDVATAIATSLISVGRADEAAALAARRQPSTPSCPAGWHGAGIAQHLVNEAHALGATPVATSRPASCSSRRSSAPLATSAMGAWIWFNMALGEIARDTGRAHETIRRFREVAEVAPRVGQDATLVWAHVGVAQGHLLLGECESGGRGAPARR